MARKTVRSWPPLGAEGFEKLHRGVCTGTATKIDGVTVDVDAAATILSIYFALEVAGRTRMELLPIRLAIGISKVKYSRSTLVDTSDRKASRPSGNGGRGGERPGTHH